MRDRPFCEMFLRQPIHICGKTMGVTQTIPQGEGGEQGDPLMPLFFALGQHGALVAMQARLDVGRHSHGDLPSESPCGACGR